MEPTTTCNVCLIVKPTSAFRKNSLILGGRNSFCIKCAKGRPQLARKANRERLKARVFIEIPKQKKCLLCKKVKESSEFHKNSSHPDGLGDECKECKRLYQVRYRKGAHYRNKMADYRFTRKYGILAKDREDIIEKQGGMCPICGKNIRGVRNHIDHDHETKQVRGVLCPLCNRGLSQFQDSVEILESAIRYLKSFY